MTTPPQREPPGSVRIVVPPSGLRELQLLGRLGKSLRSTNRFNPDLEVRELVNQLCTYGAKHHALTAPSGSVYYRARRIRHKYGVTPQPHAKPEIIAPKPDKALSGRLSPIGIPILYLAGDEATAIAEMRPWRGAKITVAPFTVGRDLKVLDLRHEEHGKDPTPQEMIWDTLGRAFSLPWDDDDNLKYLDTQYLATAFREASFDGLFYSSAMNPAGFNFAVFNPADAVPGEPRMVTVTAIAHTFS